MRLFIDGPDESWVPLGWAADPAVTYELPADESLGWGPATLEFAASPLVARGRRFGKGAALDALLGSLPPGLPLCTVTTWGTYRMSAGPIRPTGRRPVTVSRSAWAGRRRIDTWRRRHRRRHGTPTVPVQRVVTYPRVRVHPPEVR